MNAVGGKHARGHALEVLALVTRVAREGERGVLVVCVQVVRHALGGLGHHIHVHAVGAHTQRAAQARRAKGQLAIEGVKELVLVALLGELGELGRKVGLLDVVLPGLDRGLNACVHCVSPYCSWRYSSRLNHTYGTILLAAQRVETSQYADGRRTPTSGRQGELARLEPALA